MEKIHISDEACNISVDVETAGPHPNRYALLSIGACVIYDLDRNLGRTTARSPSLRSTGSRNQRITA
ncbi:MAG: hypothetical protein MUO58_11090 [Anaerolineales bacterium]|nr:hypothetical protein [Anaerolineales bacterium]